MADQLDYQKNLPTVYQQYVHQSRYARWLEEENRRETWAETVRRYVDFMVGHLKDLGYEISPELTEELFSAIVNLEVMPSMRAMMTAGPALARDHIAGFNCSYVPFDHPRAFDETLYILMCGTGVGFSVERQHIKKLPDVPDSFDKGPTVVVGLQDGLGTGDPRDHRLALRWDGPRARYQRRQARRNAAQDLRWPRLGTGSPA